jgi:hypothetical protein
MTTLRLETSSEKIAFDLCDVTILTLPRHESVGQTPSFVV